MNMGNIPNYIVAFCGIFYAACIGAEWYYGLRPQRDSLVLMAWALTAAAWALMARH